MLGVGSTGKSVREMGEKTAVEHSHIVHAWITIPTLDFPTGSAAQAVSLVFDHAVLPPSPGDMGHAASAMHSLKRGEGSGAGSVSSRVLHYGDALGRETVALHLLSDLVTFCAYGENSQKQAPPTWLRCPPPFRTFVLDLLESALLHRADAFHALPQLTVALRQKVRDVMIGAQGGFARVKGQST